MDNIIKYLGSEPGNWQLLLLLVSDQIRILKKEIIAGYQGIEHNSKKVRWAFLYVQGSRETVRYKKLYWEVIHIIISNVYNTFKRNCYCCIFFLISLKSFLLFDKQLLYGTVFFNVKTIQCLSTSQYFFRDWKCLCCFKQSRKTKAV